MSQFYVSGPCYVWVGTRVPAIDANYDSSQYDFFGFSREGVTVVTRPLTEDVPVDYAGMMPGDVSQLGADVRASGIFVRYNEFLLRNMMSSLNRINAGFGPKASVGTLLQSEPPIQSLFGHAMAGPPLLLYSSYGFKQEFNVTSNAMIKTFRIFSAYISEPLSQRLSTRTKNPEITWRSIPVFGTADPTDATGETFQPNTAPYDAYAFYAVDDVAPSALPGVN